MNAEDFYRIFSQVARQHKPVVRRDHSAVHMRRFLPSRIGSEHPASRVIAAVEEASTAECAPRPKAKRRKAPAAIIRDEGIIPRRVNGHVAGPIPSAAHPFQWC
jgi:hypothetical protein